ncbi:MAG: efflux RND transporter periplasmic adaptor subunit [Thermoanaerobaculia bacterium]|nr:efflux RND transporter periplasmic adaptor subunit [Thermoanaerobaculia bacterium]
MAQEEKSRIRRLLSARKFRVASLTLGILIVLAVAGTLLSLPGEAGDASSADDPAGVERTAENDEKESGEGDEKKAPVPVEVAAVESAEISSYLTSSANLVAEHQVRLLGEVEGRVARLLVEEGDAVRRGQPLAELVPDDAEIALKKAQLKQTNARLAWERGEDLMSKELISREEHDRLQMEHEIAGQELAEAEWRLEKTIIRAPFGGRVSERMVQPGQHVRPGDELFQVTDLGRLISRIYLPERDVIGLAEGQPVRIDLNADATVRFDGSIRQISPVVDTATGTVKVTVEAAAVPREVRPGSFVTVRIVRETRSGTPVIPRESVIRELASAHIFVADEERAARREVRLGLEEGNRVEVLEGVEPGELVIVAGQGGLRDGSPIRVLNPGDGQQSAS